MDSLYDDTIIDSINLNSSNNSGLSSKQSSSSSCSLHRKKQRCHESGARKSKRLPWNCEVIRDRFTPQPYSIQLVERYLEHCDQDQYRNLIIFSQNPSLKQYLMLACLQLHHQDQVIRFSDTFHAFLT